MLIGLGYVCFAFVSLQAIPMAIYLWEIVEKLFRKTFVKDIYTWPSPNLKGDDITPLKSLLETLPNRFGSLGAELGKEMSIRMPALDFGLLQDNFNFDFVDGAPLIWTLRSVKSFNEIKKIEIPNEESDEAIFSWDFEKDELDEIEIKSISEVNTSMLNDLEILIEEREIELNKPIIDVELELKNAKTSLASFDNKSAIESLLLIINSNTDQNEYLAESYYLLGRTYFMENEMIEAVKYFGIRHRDFSSFSKFKSENYFWLGKSLFSIGDQENGCLIMEDIIFSNIYLLFLL